VERIRVQLFGTTVVQKLNQGTIPGSGPGCLFWVPFWACKKVQTLLLKIFIWINCI